MEKLGEKEEDGVVAKWLHSISRQHQHLLDRSTIYLKTRWIMFAAALILYCVRVYLLNGWFIVTYGLGIYLLNLFLGFLSPVDDPDNDGPLLPSKSSGSEEFRPFSRRVPEFKFWNAAMNSVLICIGMTFFNFFNIPVFWPILLIYFIVLTFLTLRRQIAHMIKHKYVPWSTGKTTYSKKEKLNVPEHKENGIVL